MRNRYVSLRVSKAEYVRLESMARQLGQSKSQIVRSLLDRARVQHRPQLVLGGGADHQQQAVRT